MANGYKELIALLVPLSNGRGMLSDLVGAAGERPRKGRSVPPRSAHPGRKASAKPLQGK